MRTNGSVGLERGVSLKVLLGLTMVAGGLSACGGEPGDGTPFEESAEITAELTTVPAGISCVRITVSRGQKTLLFNVAPGSSSATLNIGRLALGQTTVEAAAFPLVCTSVTNASTPDWVSSPVTLDVKPGVIPPLRLTLVPSTNSNVSVDFLQPAVAMEAGGSSTFAIAASGDARAWGANGFNQLGDGTLFQALAPVAASLVGQVASVSTAYNHTCAVTTTGALKCWGSNSFGQLGDGTNTYRSAPVEVIASGVSNVASGENHTCVRMTDTTIRCTGANDNLQLANGTMTNSNTFVAIAASQFVEVGAGRHFNCARTIDGQVYCWGDNSSGQCGQGTSGADIGFPGVVANLRGVVELKVGDFHACARKADRTMWCWGDNVNGQLGDGTLINRPTPVQVPLPYEAVAITAGLYNSCAITSFGQVMCWGQGIYGSVGDGSGLNRTTPVFVRDLIGAVEIVSGETHVCARLDSGAVFCWGAGGWLGDGTTQYRYVPTQVLL